jgi:hypothetical protein
MAVRQFDQGKVEKKTAIVANGNCAYISLRSGHAEQYAERRIRILARSSSATDRELAQIDTDNLNWLRKHPAPSTCR